MLSWRNRLTRRIQVPVPSGVWVRLPPRALTGRGPGSKTSLQEDSAGFDSLSLHHANEEHADVHGLAMAEVAGSRPAIRSKPA